ncbi:MAG TPA: GNAT family N-acetyltransferase [Thermoanaerobaculia bacterium]|nr:GNAT family N-acetyltransferase [Thermoanaerobaculia bacterium]
MWETYREAIKPLIGPKLEGGWDDKREQDRFKAVWREDSSHIVMLDGEPIGWGAITLEATTVTIDHFYLLEAHRGKGYGTRILESLISQWNREGKEVRANVIRDNPALSLAPALGFMETEEGTSLTKSLIRKP